MKIIDILKQSSELLGLSAEIKVLNSATPENEQEILKNDEISTLFNLVKYSIQELCTNYVPVATTMVVDVKNKRYELSNLPNFIRMQNVYKNNQTVSYKIINRCLFFEEDGTFEVQYSTYPEINSLFDEFDFMSTFSPDLIVLGLASYYTLARGRFDEFDIFHDEYIEKAESLKELKTFTMPQRRWE